MKKSRKLVLHRETLHTMELRGVAGAAATLAFNCTAYGPTKWCNEGTYGTECGNTAENCSDDAYCETGGACSTGDSCPG